MPRKCLPWRKPRWWRLARLAIHFVNTLCFPLNSLGAAVVLRTAHGLLKESVVRPWVPTQRYQDAGETTVHVKVDWFPC